MSFGANSIADLVFAGAFGLLPNVRRISALGNNPDTAAPEDIWTGGGTYPWMTASTSLEILSASANDTALGTGARTVLIQGLDINYVEVNQVISMNGVTPVAIPTSIFRINGVAVVTAGSVGTNVGNITVRDAGGGTTRAIAQANYGFSRQSQFTIPAGYTAVINSYILSINRPSTARDTTLSTYIKEFGMAFRRTVELSVDGNPIQLRQEAITRLPEKTDFGITSMYTSSPNTDITAAWVGIMIPNSDIPFL